MGYKNPKEIESRRVFYPVNKNHSGDTTIIELEKKEVTLLLGSYGMGILTSSLFKGKVL